MAQVGADIAIAFPLKFVLDNFKLAVGVKKDEKRLLDEVNAWIAANLKNGRLNDLNKKYFGDNLPDPRLKHLIPDAEGAARAWAERHGGVPINHLVVIREEIARSRPDVVKLLR